MEREDALSLPEHPLRRLQAGERGQRPHLLAGRAGSLARAAPVQRLRARPRPGRHRGADARDEGGRPRRGLPHPLRRAAHVQLHGRHGAGADRDEPRRTTRARASSTCRATVCHMSELVAAIEAAAPEVAGARHVRRRASCRSRRRWRSGGSPRRSAGRSRSRRSRTPYARPSSTSAAPGRRDRPLVRRAPRPARSRPTAGRSSTSSTFAPAASCSAGRRSAPPFRSAATSTSRRGRPPTAAAGRSCSPNAGNACEVGGVRHGFHGRASHDPWTVARRVRRPPPRSTGKATGCASSRAARARRRSARGRPSRRPRPPTGSRSSPSSTLSVGLELLEPEVEIELPGGLAYELTETDGPPERPPGARRWPESLLLDGSVERCDRWPLDVRAAATWSSPTFPRAAPPSGTPRRGQGLELRWDADWLRHLWIWHEVRTYERALARQAEILAIEPASVPHGLGLADGDRVTVRRAARPAASRCRLPAHGPPDAAIYG